MKSIKLVYNLMLGVVSFLLLFSCKGPEIQGTYWPNNPISIELDLWENFYEFYDRVDQSAGNTDMILLKRVSFLKGTFSINKNKLIIHDSINHKNYYFDIQNDECLICKSTFLLFKPNDTLLCKTKLYPDGKIKWQEGSGDTIFIRTYYNHEYQIIKDVYYNRKRNIVRVKKISP